MSLYTLLLLIPVFPLLGFLCNIFLYKKVKASYLAYLGTAVIGISFWLSLTAFVYVFNNDDVRVYNYFTFLNIGQIKLDFGFLLDRLNGLYLLMITGIGFFIHLYSISYMHSDKGMGRYFAYLNLFVFSMLLLVLGNNYVILFIGWEGVGLCSFLLIGFWYEDLANMRAAKKAFVMNRIGDLCFLLALFLLLEHYGTLNFSDMASAVQHKPISSSKILAITILMFVGATGKSAQIPLYTWLPDAMAGPTPVSALIHAATMVTAGIYLIARSQVLFLLAPLTLEIIAIIGLATALLAALIATKQTDIKKVLAYSTVSQLGFMFMAIGTGAFQVAIFHVITHAFFKALLFLGSGSVIHAMGGEQDISKMGKLGQKMFLTQLTFLIGCCAIAGMPGFSGFFSKDAILLSAFHYNNLYFSLALFCALLTAFYMFRLYFLTFYGKFRGTESQWKHLHESPVLMLIPLLVLAFFAIISGYIDYPEVFGGHMLLSNFLSTVLTISPQIHISHKAELILMFVPVLVIIGIFFACMYWYAIRVVDRDKITSARGGYRILANKFYIDELYALLVIKPVNFLGHWFNSIVEYAWIDRLIEGCGRVAVYLGYKFRYLQDGKISSYFFWMILGIILLFGVLLLRNP